jgi:hypothetical protein
MSVQIFLEEAPSVVEGQDRIAVGLCIAAATLILLLPTFINGYPFILSDSGTYLRAAVELRPVDDRPIFYSIALRLLHWRISPWPIVVAQSATVAFLIHLVARTVFGIRQAWVTIAVCAVLAAVSSLPWFVGQIMTDIFAAVLMLLILLLAMGWQRMTTPERAFVIVVFAACISFHNANLMIALMAVPTLAVMYLLGWRPGPFALGRLALVAGAIALALTALISVNVAMRGRFVVSAASSTFMMAKLLEDGPALWILEEECPGKYRLCSVLADLEAHKAAVGGPSLGDHFLWGGPVHDLGWIKAVEPEAADVVRQALRRYWRQELLTAISNGANQLVHFDIGDDMGRSPQIYVPIESLRYVFGNSSVEALNRSLQGQGELHFDLINKIALTAIIVSIGVMACASVYFWRLDRLPLQVTAFALIMVSGHAWLVGALTPLHDRYQSRVIWLLPLMAMLIVIRELAAERPKRGGLSTRRPFTNSSRQASPITPHEHARVHDPTGQLGEEYEPSAASEKPKF